ncbi:arginase [Nocardioides sp. MAH-18]|uniref:Arginase n=1 Tax=Nocardioides agri TaxID=2682843 RepID=A0A6L6XWT0_9ACTN|nr:MULTISPECIES: arginase family protein [unclassified Nocardioides]MBA2952348.1 arginase family protein [Nocardioides sp. CGMCC 1.13656]MVQ51508.1 arginase [Nocardioides sp. MAH-18]
MATINVLGYPSSAAAYCVGVEQAPTALREAGLVGALHAAGHEVKDAGDLAVRRWRPDRERPYAQNLDDEIAGLRELADAAHALMAPDELLLVLGGSCTVALGTCAAAARAGTDAQLVYVDRHLDLNTPISTTEGSLSWMGMAHALDLDGAAPELVGAVGPRPLLRPGRLSYLGVDLAATTAWERDRARELDLTVVTQAALVADPPAAAATARAGLAAEPFLVHVDVDVLDFLDAPLAENVNGRNSGPTVSQLGRALAELWRDPHCLGLSVGQLVPAHAASDPRSLGRLIEALVPPVDR